MQNLITNPLLLHALFFCRFLRSNKALVEMTEHLFYVHQFQKLADPAAFTAAEDVHAIGEALLKKTLIAVWNKFYDMQMPWPTPDDPDGMCFPLRGVGYMADAFVFERSFARMAPDFTQVWEAKHFVDLLRDMLEQAGYMRMAGIMQREEEDKLVAAFMSEEQLRLKKAAKAREGYEKLQQEEAALKELEATGLDSDEQIDEFRKRKEKLAAKRKKKEEERTKKEAKAKEKEDEKQREARRQWKLKKAEEEAARKAEDDRLNELAVTNPEEYDRLMADRAERDKLEHEEREAKAAKRRRVKAAREKRRREAEKREEEGKNAAPREPFFMT